MMAARGPFKTPPPSLPPHPARAQGEAAEPPSSAADAPHGLGASRRSVIPAFEVMQITGEVERRRAEGRDIVSLCAGEPSARPAPGMLKPAGYTSPLGTAPLRAAIAGHYANWHGVSIDPARVAVTTGSSGAFQLVFLAAFDPGDRVALASPGYPAYRNILRSLGVDVVEIPTGPETRYQPTPALLDAAVAAHGPLAGLIVASPANPTGSMLSRAELSTLVEWCAEQRVRLISDEIYHGITYAEPGSPDARGVSAVELDSEAIAINSFSKYWGMTGWRLGWAVLPESLIAPMEALASNFALSPPAPAQELALGAFSEERYAERDAVVAGFARARALILDAEPALRWGESAPSDGAFYFYADLGPQLERFGDSLGYARALLDGADVAVVPGVDFDPVHGTRTVRLSFAAGEAAVEEALSRILRFQGSKD
ncbi:aspartate aminotransferase [Leucobacter sp. OLJS4]|nr:aspartate aminotransferase [Leucobacter sp. OLCALW19]PII87079.1 aspartate aminotransferase [Leucobacter sp. OLTLW20]PII91344.1 aspartate aminotransferase [Leucobacter sp. OLAS13]PII98803.1 aspartate aminotransferase [Leucobacter sp. OLDS2]PIJ04080.1 aspartate aminotransferase [Leucobacter sp. OLIS6]PIJ13031.1 aspartate aminotransferase [Leucobacter sp. OLJS4]PIJ54590.1 aspartate aminotransferase [Leucobacter sp. OAMSW11]